MVEDFHVVMQAIKRIGEKPIGMSYLHGLSQPSVSNAVREVTTALNNINILQKYVKFPQTQAERQHIINGFVTFSVCCTDCEN